ncbi:MAG: ATP-binding protein [Blastocatellia bacterium]|nr:ATP-binding protein [Blastocatellia bacterium]
MRFSGVESKARLVMALFVVALLLTIGLSLTLYSQARRELANQRVRQMELEASLLVSRLSDKQTENSSNHLKQQLERSHISATVALFSVDRKLIALASTTDRMPDVQALSPKVVFSDAVLSKEDTGTDPPTTVHFRNEAGFEIVETLAQGSTALVLARPVSEASSPIIFYVASYQVIALILGIGLVFLLVRWLLRPYRRMVEAARGSPVRASSAMSESEFVVETFQALVEQLKAKERELAHLHETERNRAERSEHFSERLIANMPSGLVAIDAAGTVTSANARAIEIFSLAETSQLSTVAPPFDGKLQALSIDYRVLFESAPKMAEMIARCLSDGISFRREEVEVIAPDGRLRHIGLSVSPIGHTPNSQEGALCLMTDLTEVIELRERMKLQESLANLGEMAAGLAHEFKNSLATIQGYVQLLDAQIEPADANDDRRQSLDATLNEVRLLARLITDFLNFARPQQLNLSRINLRSIIEDCAGEIGARISQAGIELRIKGNFADFEGDESMLRRAFVNLMRNAVEAIDSQAPDKLIEVTGTIVNSTGRRYAHVRIRDTGSGISPEDMHRIFIPFYTTKSRGYGIGLAIVQKIIVAHGGNVTVESSDSSGTIFDCRLPLLWPSQPVEQK